MALIVTPSIWGPQLDTGIATAVTDRPDVFDGGVPDTHPATDFAVKTDTVRRPDTRGRQKSK